MKYVVIYEKSATGYGSYVPDLPGCAATGRTRALTKQRIAKAIKMHIDAMRADGESIPEPTTTVEYIEASIGTFAGKD